MGATDAIDERRRAEAAGSLWRNRDYNLLWSTQAVSTLGGQSAQIAYPLLVLGLTGSATAAGGVGTARLIAGYVGALLGGAAVDRYERRHVIAVSEAARCASMLLIGVQILADHAAIGVIYATAAVDGLFDTPVESAVDGDRAGRRRRSGRAGVARDQARDRGAALAGPPLGGVLYGLGASLPFLTNAASYLASLIGARKIKASLAVQRTDEPREPFSRELTAGFHRLVS